MLLLSLSIVNAQNIDSTNKAEKGFFKGWRVAGVSIGIGILDKFDKSSGLSMYQNITKSNISETKLNNDLEAIKKYPNWSVDDGNYGQNVTFPLRVILKPKKIEHNKLKSYIELNLALLYSIQLHTTYLGGWQKTSSSTTKSYNTSYRVETRSFAIDGLITLQTPGIFSLFSIYSGIGVYGGGNFDNFVYSSSSSEREDSSPFSSGTSKTIIASTNHFYLPAVSFGAYLPVGIKLNISKRSNLYLEYTFDRRTLVFRNFYPQSFWYKGFGLGYRYKFVKPQKKKRTPLNAPANPPKPFY